MTVLRAEFEYAAKIRKKGHRKTADVVVRETAPFVVPDFAEAEAPVALRFADDARGRGTETLRGAMDGLFAPVLETGAVRPAQVPIEGRDHAAFAELRTETCPTTVGSLFRLGLPEAERICDPEGLGHRVLASERDAHRAEAGRRASADLAAIGGHLYMRVPEPMLVVALRPGRDARTRAAVHVDYDPVPGALCAASESLFSLAHFRLDQAGEATALATALALRFGFGDAEPAPGGPARPEVVDASLLRADPLLVTLDQSIRSLLLLGHETLAAAPDGFVLAWADMRESLALIERGHPDAAATAAAALRAFLDHAPVGGVGSYRQFASQAEQRRWETRTLPLLTARVAAVEALETNPSAVPGP